MSKIDLTIHKEGLLHNIQKAKENNIIIPTIAQMQNPDLIPEKIKEKLTHTGLWDVDPVNLFRISWHTRPRKPAACTRRPRTMLRSRPPFPAFRAAFWPCPASGSRPAAIRSALPSAAWLRAS